MSNTIIWIGPLLTNESLKDKKAASPAANVWQKNFIQGLNANDFNVLSFSYLPEPSWPNGSLWVKGHKCIESTNNFDQKTVSYLNLIFVRELFIALNIVLKMLRLDRAEILFLYSYNPLLRHIITGTFFKRVFKKKWVSIIADDIKKGNPDYNMFLSYNYYLKSDKGDSLFCDGGVPQRVVQENISLDAIKPIVYSGSINVWTGIFEFVEMFGKLKSKNHHLHIYGKGQVEELKSLIDKAKFKNITVYGFVEDSILSKSMEKAFAFVNPRNTTLKNSENNFPSKLLLYLSYEKPIVSTFSLGLSPAIKDVLLEYRDLENFSRLLNSLSNDLFYFNIVQKIIDYKLKNTWKAKTMYSLKEINSK
jgi:hypothetical protein